MKDLKVCMIVVSVFFFFFQIPEFENNDVLTAEKLNKLVQKINDLEEIIQDVPIGTVFIYAGKELPSDNFLWCDGELISAEEFDKLSVVLGNIYSEKDDSKNVPRGFFRLPNLNDRVPVGKSIKHSLGKEFGKEFHELNVNELPSHNHEIDRKNLEFIIFGDHKDGSFDVTQGSAQGRTEGRERKMIEIKNTGNGVPFNLYQPSLALNYIIKAK